MQENHDRYAQWNSLEDTDLKQIIYEKTEGKAVMSRFPTRASLLEAVLELEEGEEKVKALKKMQRTPLSPTVHESLTVKFLFCTG